MTHPLKVSSLVLVVLVTTGIGCMPAVQIHTIQSPAAHFERYRTIAFDSSRTPPSHYTVSPRSAEVRDRVEKAAASILQARGYVLAPNEQADLIVRIEAGRRVQEVPTSTGLTPLGGGADPTLSGGSNGPPGGGGGLPGEQSVPGPTNVEMTYHGQLDQEERDLVVEGAFIIDAFDRESREVVWHGSARSELNPGPIDEQRLRKAVGSVLASFPSRPGYP
jgi:hypothetical protein